MKNLDLALAAAKLEIAGICECSHHRSRHDTDGTWCYSCARNRDECTHFRPAPLTVIRIDQGRD